MNQTVLLSTYETEVLAPPETVLARLRTHLRSSADRPSLVPAYETFRGPQVHYVRVPTIGAEPLHGTVDNDSFEICARNMFVKLRGRVCASPAGSRIVAGVYLEPVVILVSVILGVLALLDFAVRPSFSDPSRPNAIPPGVLGLIWILALVPLAWSILSDIPRAKNALTQVAHLAAAEHRLNLDSQISGASPEGDSSTNP